MNPTIPNNELPSLCGSCKGACCKSIPGATMPEDWGPAEGRLERLTQALASRLWAIDWWNGDPRYEGPEGLSSDTVYFIRPASEKLSYDDEDSMFAQYSGPCRLLTDKGCSLTWDQRPTECRGLVPQLGENGKPACRGSKETRRRSCAVSWIPHQSLIAQAAKATGRPMSRNIPVDNKLTLC